MRLRVIVLTVLLVASLGGCLEKENAEADLRRLLLATERQSREFVYEEKSGDQVWVVKGEFQDDLRMRASSTLNGAEVGEAVISDDTLALRVIDPALAGLDAAATGTVTASLEALRQGRWVVDPSATLPLRAPVTEKGSIAVGGNPVLDAKYLFQYLRRAVDEGQDVWLFNPDDPDYKPAEDPFDDPVEGVIRYDVRAAPLPRRSQRGTTAALPTAAHFRRLAFYTRGGLVLRIQEQIDFESHRDFRRAQEGTGPKYPLEILEAVRAGRTLEPIRTRSMKYTISRPGSQIEITVPSDNALIADMTGFFGPQAIATPPAT